MSAESQVAGFYDEHPINEGEILSKLKDAGKDVNALVAEDLFAYDQDHYGGLEATDALAALLGLDASSHVLDVCSGMGGTSRYLAWKHGCRVLGVDMTGSRVRGADNLTAMVGLDDRVSFIEGDACALELPPRELRCGGGPGVVSAHSRKGGPARVHSPCAQTRRGAGLHRLDRLAGA